MSFMKRSIVAFSAALCTLATTSVLADVWVFEPSVTLDQRFDDNYYLLPSGADSLSATRGVAEMGLSREASNYVLKGLARIDTLFTTDSNVGGQNLDSNWIAALDARQRTARSRYGVRVNYKRDTPSRDIAADISDNDAVAEDTNPSALVTQSLSSNVAREEYTIEPSFEYDVTRRLQFKVDVSLEDVSHDLPRVQDAIYQHYLQVGAQTINRAQTDPNYTGPVGYYDCASNTYSLEPLPYDQVSIDTVCVFSPSGELDDYREGELKFGLRYKLTPIANLTATASYSRFVAQVLASPQAFFTTDPQQYFPDEDERQLLRRPRRDLVSTTTKVTLGYERLLTPTLQFVIDGGVYTNTTDDSDTFRNDDVTFDGSPGPEVGKETQDGWLASTSLTYDAGATRYSGRFAVDVVPSSAGAQVETNELTGDVRRTLSPRLDVSLRARAFEPDRLGAKSNDQFARRFISFEPRVQWKYSRNWTVSAGYRYRRQKARVDVVSAESNAILLAIKYTPPSEIRDAARASGL